MPRLIFNISEEVNVYAPLRCATSFEDAYDLSRLPNFQRYRGILSSVVLLSSAIGPTHAEYAETTAFALFPILPLELSEK